MTTLSPLCRADRRMWSSWRQSIKNQENCPLWWDSLYVWLNYNLLGHLRGRRQRLAKSSVRRYQRHWTVHATESWSMPNKCCHITGMSAQKVTCHAWCKCNPVEAQARTHGPDIIHGLPFRRLEGSTNLQQVLHGREMPVFNVSKRNEDDV